MKQNLWSILGQVLYFVTQFGIRIVVNGSHRTRVLIVCDGKFLALQHWLGDGTWTLPGGGLHNNEDRLTGAAREVLEEIGVIIEPLSFVHKGTFEANKNGYKFTYDLFIVELISMPALQLQTFEILESKWFEPQYAQMLKATPELRQAVTIWQE